MTGVLFIINVPQKDHEVSILKQNSQIFDSKNLAKTKDVHIAIHKSDSSTVHKSKSEITLNLNEKDEQSYLKLSWKELKQMLKTRRNKLKITRPVRSIDVLNAFHWDTPLETILSEVMNRLDVKNAAWCATNNNQFWQVSFTLEGGCLCEELLQVLRTFGIGSRHQSSLSVVPCNLFYESHDRLSEENEQYANDSKTSPWSRFSSSVHARTNLAQVLHAVKADAAVTFDWCFLLLVAALVASIGLVESSTVVLVASMLISPLLGPITAGTLGSAVRDRSLQTIGVTHELLGLFMCLAIGFIFGLAICIVDSHYGFMNDWPSDEMMSRCEYRSMWVGMMVAIPSGAGVALAVLGDYTASLVGVAISASLLPPAVNAGLLWAMSVFRLISGNDMSWRVGQPSELALLGSRSLCLTLINILCIFVAGVTVYKVKQVCPLERRDITWWRANKSRLQASKIWHGTAAWEIYSKWSTNVPEEKSQEAQYQSDTVTFRRPHMQHRIKSQSLEECLRNMQMNERYQQLDSKEKASESQNSVSSKEPNELDTTDSSQFSFYNLGYEIKETQEIPPTIEPSFSFTIDTKKWSV